jgi:phosphate transport system protein
MFMSTFVRNNLIDIDMTHLDTELQILRSDITDEWELVITQLGRAHEAMEHFNKDIIGEIAAAEKLIDAFELKVDMDCENILALYSPVANDLRLVLAVLKINYNLERIGDFAWGIAKIVRDAEKPLSEEVFKKTHFMLIFDTTIGMLKDALAAFENENSTLAMGIFEKDHILDQHNKNSAAIITSLIGEHPDDTRNLLELFSIFRKIERAGDHIKNISEEIIFYREAKVLRHKKKKLKKTPDE